MFGVVVQKSVGDSFELTDRVPIIENLHRDLNAQTGLFYTGFEETNFTQTHIELSQSHERGFTSGNAALTSPADTSNRPFRRVIATNYCIGSRPRPEGQRIQFLVTQASLADPAIAGRF